MSIGRAGAPRSPLRRAAMNLAAWLRLIVRPRRFKASRLLPPTRRLALGAIAGFLLVGVAMAFIDTRAVMFARTLPPWLVDTFNEITDYGRSAWFLVPLAGLILLAAALAPIAGRVANLVLLSLVMRLHYLFLAIALPGLAVTVIKGLIGRVRPSRIFHGPGSISTRACRPGTRPRPLRPRSRSRRCGRGPESRCCSSPW
jgi:hypothetical protein